MGGRWGDHEVYAVQHFQILLQRLRIGGQIAGIVKLGWVDENGYGRPFVFSKRERSTRLGGRRGALPWRMQSRVAWRFGRATGATRQVLESFTCSSPPVGEGSAAHVLDKAAYGPLDKPGQVAVATHKTRLNLG